MANEVEYPFTSGLTLYFRLRNSIIQPYNTVGLAFENWLDANVAQYAIAMAEQSVSGFYHGDMPTGLAAGFYKIVVLVQLGGSPALGDVAIAILNVSWNGTTIVSLQTVDSDVLTLIGRTDPTTVLAEIATDTDTIITSLGTLQTTATDIQTDLDEVQAVIGAGSSTILTDIQTDLDEVQTAVASVQAKTDLLSFQGSSVVAYVAYIPPTGYVIGVSIDPGASAGEITNLPPQTDVSIARGTDFPLIFEVTSAVDSSIVDLTNYEVEFMVKEDLDSPDLEALIHKNSGTPGGVTIPDPTTGVIHCPILAADTAEDEPYLRFPRGVERWYSIKLYHAGLSIPGPWGKFLIAPFGVSTNTSP